MKESNLRVGAETGISFYRGARRFVCACLVRCLFLAFLLDLTIITEYITIKKGAFTSHNGLGPCIRI